jgi:P-type Cu2+ transporter
VIALVRQGQESRSRSQDPANSAAVWLTAVALVNGTVTLGTWLALGASLPFAIERTVTVMVIARPHALGLAVPLVVAESTTLAAGNGLLISDRSAFERARALDAIVFDKTGTLTEGRFGVTDVIPLGSRGEEELLRLAASLESRSEHPIAMGWCGTRRNVALGSQHPPTSARFQAKVPKRRSRDCSRSRW